MKKILIFSMMLALAAAAPAFAANVGEAAPDFKLLDVDGGTHTLGEFKGRTVVLEWTNPDCPFVKRHYDSGNMQALQQDAAAKNVAWLTVASSGAGKQGNYDAAGWKKLISEKGHASTVLLDADGSVGKAYGAKTTPHMFVVNPEGNLIYKGALDDKPSTDANEKSSKNYVTDALNESSAGKLVSTPSTESYGCSVKY